ncbi:mitochondrial 18 KDa protein-domain-containing protein [Aspergillus caelatus]|uniref:Mitochondrial fission process protein 1 n=1 Tax=Aspergillus caelatus TaxID=61420 RepID=A0A5N6ZTC3_9EURO|nr:mitochondrial 18 KDa protein-domain-containing protein [Aspergillus caelatus]KAE8360854.1 mitochondrial 18 KDa protein-domain-containing protein [Aspergillus caelatus]
MLWYSRDNEGLDVYQNPIPRVTLPPALQSLVDRDEDEYFYEDIYPSYHIDCKDTPYRYTAYSNRIQTILFPSYNTGISESLRPAIHPYFVRCTHAISWAYVFGDVVHEGYKAYLRNRSLLAPLSNDYKDARDLTSGKNSKGQYCSKRKSYGDSQDKSVVADDTSDTLTPWPTIHIPLAEDYRAVMFKRAIFQSIASMALPAITIHSVVRYSGQLLKNSKNVFCRTWAPIGLGFICVPFLPFVFDRPVEKLVEWSFANIIIAPLARRQLEHSHLPQTSSYT